MPKPPTSVSFRQRGSCATGFLMQGYRFLNFFVTSRQNIGQLISKILKENELTMKAVVKKYFTTATNSKQYNIVFYSLEMIIAVGYRVRGVRGTHI